MTTEHRPMAEPLEHSGQTPEGLSQLLGLVAKGDRNAFSQLYSDTSRKLFGVLLHLLRRQDWAEDHLHDTYVKIWQRAASFQPQTASAMTWMISIARNSALDEIRRRRLYESHDEDAVAGSVDPESNPRLEVERTQQWQRLDGCLQSLGDPQAAMIKQAYLDGTSRKQLASQFQRPENTVKTWLHRGLSQLKDCMGES